jgi:hypothetical protein
MASPKLPESYRVTSERLYAEISTKLIGKMAAWDLATAQQQVGELRRFFATHRDDLGDGSFLLELTQDDDSAFPALNARTIIDANLNEPALVRVGMRLGVIEVVSLGLTDDSEPDEMIASERSTDSVIVFYEQRNLVRFYANGQTVGLLDPQSSTGKTGKLSRFGRRAEQYADAILDHYRERVRDFQSDHWSDRPKRKLRAKLGRAVRTEDIFLNSLLEWLTEHLAASVKGNVGQVTRDKTDIEITAPGKLYIIEIKWLGENDNGTSYSIVRVTDGLRQVRDYLAKQGMAKHATLLVYDGRTEAHFGALENVLDEPDPGCKCVSECAGERVSPRGSCMILFLRSTTASET